MSLKIKESELKALLDEVASDLSKAFESEKGQLAKAALSNAEMEKSALAKDDAPGEESSPDESASAPPAGPPDESAPPMPEEGSESAPPPDASASPDMAPSPEGMDPAADQSAALTPEALQSEYSKLAPEELDMHIKAALAAKAAVAGAPDASAGAPPMGASAPPGAPPMDPMAMKSELSVDQKANGGQISKSEKHYDDEIESLKALVKSQAEDTENLAKALKLVLEQPMRKAVTSVAHLPKAETEKAPLTRASVNARLKELSMKPDLKKSDRQLINDFYDGRVSADKLAPLFEDYK